MTLQRILAWIVNTFWWGVALSIIIVGLYISLGRYYLPLLNQFEPRFERYASQLLQAQVESASLWGKWEKFNPIVGVNDLRVYGKGSRDDENLLVSLTRVDIEFDILRSIVNAEPVYRQLHLQDLTLHLYKNDSGRWASPLFSSTGGGLDFANLYSAAHDLKIENTQLVFHDDQQINILHIHNIELQQGANLKQAILNISDNDATRPLTLIVESSGAPKSKNFQLKAHFVAQDVDISTSQFLLKDQWVTSSLASLVFWLSWSPDKGLEAEGQLDVKALTLANNVVLGHVKSDIRVAMTQAETRVFMANASLDIDGELIQLPASRVDINADGDWLASIDTFDLTQVKPLARLIPAKYSLLGEALTTLNFRGHASDIAVSVAKKKNRWEPSVKASLDQVSVDSWRGVPSFKRVSGQLNQQGRRGRIQLEKASPSLDLAPLYDEAFNFTGVSGSVFWEVDERVSVAVKGLSFEFEGMAGMIDLALDARVKDTLLPSTLSLVVTAKQGRGELIERLMPDQYVDQDFKEWLHDAQIKGEITSGYFTLHASLSRDQTWFPNLQVAGQVRESSLLIGTDWPKLTLPLGSILLSNQQFQLQAATAGLLNSTLDELSIGVDTAQTGVGLMVDSNLSGETKDILYLFQHTPLAEAVAHGADGWESEQGRYAAELSLKGTLKDIEKLQVFVNAEVSNTRLSHPVYELKFDGVNGDIFYTDGALRSSNLSAIHWGKPWAGTLSSQRTAGQGNAGTFEHTLSLMGKTDARDVAAWLQQPFLHFVEGTFLAQVELHLVPERAPILTVQSDLTGATINLPKPFYKPAAAVQTLALELVVLPVPELTLSTGLAHLKLWLEDIPVGHIRLDRTGDFLKPAQGLHLEGYLSRVQADEWLAVLDQYNAYSEGYPADNSGVIDVSQMKIDTLYLGDNILTELTVSAHNEGDHWRAGIDSEALRASAQWQGEDPFQIDIAYVQLPFEEKSLDSNELASRFLPVDVPEADVKISELMFGDEHYGSWQFSSRSVTNGVTFDNIFGHFKGLDLHGDSPDQGAKLQWFDELGQITTHLAGAITTANVKDLFTAYKIEPMLVSETALANVELSWQGDPHTPPLMALNGRVLVNLTQGQFLRTEGAPTGILKLLGVLNFDNLVRRLKLDFGDLVNEGLSYDKLSADMLLSPGRIDLQTPLRVDGPSSDFRLSGSLDLKQQSIDGQLTAVVPISKNLPWVAALAGGLPAAAGVYVVSKVFSDSFDRLSSAVYSIKGPWGEPEVAFEHFFEGVPD